MNQPALLSPSKLSMSWLQVRMAWQSVKNIRLDQEKKDVITALLGHYRSLREADRPRLEFEQVLLKLEEEHNLRVRELGTEGRRVAKQANNIIQVIRDTNEARMQQCRDRVQETQTIIADWKSLIDQLFEDTVC
jgi:DNA integrity scanning protein DisA with diadenylate cyclase activity